MRTRKAKDRSRLIQAAMGQIPCDLTIGNVQFFNVITGEIYPASVDILDGFVVLVREEGQEAVLPSKTYYDGQGRYLIPGYIDTHMHIESTMMIPENLARAILPWGTTTICTDPHEIGNVMGLDGVRFMLANAKKSKLRQYVLAPSCVPSVPGMENAGAEFLAKEVGELLDMDDVIGIAEIRTASACTPSSTRACAAACSCRAMRRIASAVSLRPTASAALCPTTRA